MWTDAWSLTVSSIRWKALFKMHIANDKMKHNFPYVKFIFVSVYNISLLPQICPFINITSPVSLCSLPVVPGAQPDIHAVPGPRAVHQSGQAARGA